MNFQPKQHDKVLIIATQQEATVTGSETNTNGTWYYLKDENGYVMNQDKGCNFFASEELDYTDWQKEYFEEEARDNYMHDYNCHSNI